MKSLMLFVLLTLVSSARADGPDFSMLSAAVDFSSVSIALLAISAVMVLPIVVKWGVSRILAFIEPEYDPDGFDQDTD